MITRRDGKTILTTPVSREDLEGLHVGDQFYLTGSLTAGRDMVHYRVTEEGRPLPVEIRNCALLHAGPIARLRPDGTYEIVAMGPTTSMRMERFEYEFVKRTGVRVIVGKGAMGPHTERACREFGAIQCVFPAGSALVAATAVEKVIRAEWLDLGMPEAVWQCGVREYGPLIVAIDVRGRNWLREKKEDYLRRRDEQIPLLRKALDFMG